MANNSVQHRTRAVFGAITDFVAGGAFLEHLGPRLDHRRINGDRFRGGWFGGGMHVAPTARLDDGLLEVVRFGNLARRDFVISLPRLYRGTHYTHPQVTHSRGAAVEAESLGAPGSREIEIEADGELVGALPARLGVLPAALSLLA